MAARRKRLKGFFPWLGRWLVAGAGHLARHPHLPIAAGLLAAATTLVWQVMCQADLFRVTRIELPDGSPLIPPSALLQRNIWDVNLRAVAEELADQQPALKEVRVIRELPSVIRIEPVWRVPVAQLRLERRWHLVDQEGVVWPDGALEPVEHVIRIVGMEQAGTADTLSEAEIQLALRVVQRVDRAAARLAPRVTKINVADPREIRLTLEADAVPTGRQVEVRCGAETELDAQLERLEASLRALDRHALPVKTIDVRFPEPVVIPS
jgi:cell division septal protein FtsQ